MKKNKIKILIGFHKPYKLIKNELFVPIHVGRKIAMQKNKDGNLSKDDYNWLLKNTIGDNTGENISDKNRGFSESTAIYWAWKNLDKLDNPDYIGFMHYRRYFDFDKVCKENNIEDFISNYDVIMLERFGLDDKSKNNYNQFKCFKFLHIEDFDKCIEVAKRLYPDYSESIDKYLNLTYAYFCNMFIMKKEIFNDYCKWMFSILRQVENEIDISNYNIDERRIFGHLAERLTGIYYTHLIDTNKEIKTTEIPLKMINDNGYYFNQIKSIVRKLKALYN